MAQTNQKIRRTAATAGVKLWQIAEQARHHGQLLFPALLRKEFPADKQTEILRFHAELEQEAG